MTSPVTNEIYCYRPKKQEVGAPPTPPNPFIPALIAAVLPQSYYDVHKDEYWRDSGAGLEEVDANLFFENFSRPSTALYLYLNNVLSFADANTPRIYDYYNGDRQMYLNSESVLNKVMSQKINPISFTNMRLRGDYGTRFNIIREDASYFRTMVDGFGKILNTSVVCFSRYVFEVDNRRSNREATVDFYGYSGNTETHTSSLFLRIIRDAQRGNVNLGFDDGQLGPDLSETGDDYFSSYRQATFTGTPLSNFSRMRLRVDEDGIVRFIIPGFYERSIIPRYPVVAQFDDWTSVLQLADDFPLSAFDQTLMQGAAATALVYGEQNIGDMIDAQGAAIPTALISKTSQNEIASRTDLPGDATITASFGFDSPISSQFGVGYSADATGRNLYVNRGIVSSDANLLPTRTSLSIGSDQDGSPSEGWYDAFVFKNAVTDAATLQSASTPYETVDPTQYYVEQDYVEEGYVYP